MDYREKQGYFQSPDDLAKVKGIGFELAVTLSPQIDWILPENDSEVPIDWLVTLFFLFTTIVFVYQLAIKMFPSVIYSFSLLDKLPNGWVLLWINSSLTLSMITGIILFTNLLFVTLSKSTDKITSSIAFSLRLILFEIITWTLAGTGHAINYQFYPSLSGGWEDLLRNQSYLLGLTAFSQLAILNIPKIIVLFKPKSIHNTLLARFYDIGLLLGIVVWLWVIRFDYGQEPIWILLWDVLVAVYFCWRGFLGIRSGRSLFYEQAEDIVESILETREKTVSYWKKWVNYRVPNPDDQKSLLQALEEIHPKSKLNTFINAVIFGAGGWLLLTALSGVIQWLLEKYLNNLFP